MEPTRWLSYNDLAWTELIIAPPEDCKEEAALFCQVIKEHSRVDVKTLLHLGCGAGIYDYTFKKHFQVTGVDISEGMLKVASSINPEVNYLLGDMRSIRMDDKFDCVAIPDSIFYMKTKEELHKAVSTAYEHLVPGGMLLITAQIAEQFEENNFVYTGSKDGIEITLFENNHIPLPFGSTYEAVFIYLIRRSEELEIFTDIHELGLFEMETWVETFDEFNFEVKQLQMNHLYDPYIMGEGEYPLVVFVCQKEPV